MGVLNRAAIKQEAKSFISIDTKWFKMFFATVIIYLVSQSLTVGVRVYDIIDSFSISYYSDYYNTDGTVSLFGCAGFVIGLIVMPFMVSISGYYLNHIRGFNPDWRSIYKEGFDNFGKYLSVSFTAQLVTVLWSLLFIIPGIVKAMAYSQVNYIIHDNNNLSSSDVRKISNIMTKGYKSDIFIMYLSFILWWWLIPVTFGVASVYVIPYFNTTCAMYYENLKRNAIEKGLIAPEAFGMTANFAQPNDYNQQGDFSQDYDSYSYSEYHSPSFTKPDSERTFNPNIVDGVSSQNDTYIGFSSSDSGAAFFNSDIKSNNDTDNI